MMNENSDVFQDDKYICSECKTLWHDFRHIGGGITSLPPHGKEPCEDCTNLVYPRKSEHSATSGRMVTVSSADSGTDETLTFPTDRCKTCKADVCECCDFIV